MACILELDTLEAIAKSHVEAISHGEQLYKSWLPSLFNVPCRPANGKYAGMAQ